MDERLTAFDTVNPHQMTFEDLQNLPSIPPTRKRRKIRCESRFNPAKGMCSGTSPNKLAGMAVLILKRPQVLRLWPPATL